MTEKQPLPIHQFSVSRRLRGEVHQVQSGARLDQVFSAIPLDANRGIIQLVSKKTGKIHRSAPVELPFGGAFLSSEEKASLERVGRKLARTR